MSKCQTCNEEFSEEFRIPKVLPCGHTYCLICIYSLFQKHNVFVCQDCSYPIQNPMMIEKLPNNKTLLAFIQQQKAQKYMDDSASNFFSQNSSNPFLDTQDSIHFSPGSFEVSRNMSDSRMKQFSDSFNFDPFKAFLEEGAQSQSRAFQRCFTDPRKSRSKTPSKKFNDIEISSKGIFREKTPPRIIEACSIKMCNNEKMYYKGALQPFCSFHCAQQNNSLMIDEKFQTPDRIFKMQGFPNSDGPFNAIPMTVSQPYNPSYSQPNKKNPWELFSSPQENEKAFPKFGKATALKKFMNFYEQGPGPNKTPGSDSLNTTMNSSVFSCFGPKENVSLDFGQALENNSNKRMPFPEVQINSSQQDDSSNKCVIPGCPNDKFVRNGIKYPFCSRKCSAKAEQVKKEEPFWN